MGWAGEGPYTGEISPKCCWRWGPTSPSWVTPAQACAGETDEMVNRKVLCAAEYGLTALLCIGETAEEGVDWPTRCSAPSSAGLYGLDAGGRRAALGGL